MDNKKVALIIMDGWGHGQVPKVDAIKAAKTPFVNGLYNQYPNSELLTFGKAVGLPEGQMGNSEVGHINIGAGRVVFQELQRIFNTIKNKEINENPILNNLINYCNIQHKPLHFLGLVSDGGVHSHYQHLIALLKICDEKKLPKVCVHAFTDGRDTDPKSSISFLKEVEKNMNASTQHLSTITGRYYAMDRDNRWERVALAYNALVNCEGEKVSDYEQAIQFSYEQNITDEFLKPIILREQDVIKPDDAVLFFNFRTDRCREIVKALSQEDYPKYGMNKLPIKLATMTRYDKTFRNVDALFDNENLDNTLGEIISKQGMTQLRIAETEKYPHVTFFFNGGREQIFKGEDRIMIPSPKVATYDFQPEMSAYEVAQQAVHYIDEKQPDFMCLNFANADMVGHTGVWKAAIKAVETVDACVEKVVNACLNNDMVVLLTSDHGNSDYLINEDGTPNTAHTTNLVPLFLIDKKKKYIRLKNGKLSDIAPTILQIMGVSKPKEMIGQVLV